jgi:hypothetical protein
MCWILHIWDVDKSRNNGPCICRQYQNNVTNMVGRRGWNLATTDTKVGTTVTQLEASHNANA